MKQLVTLVVVGAILALSGCGGGSSTSSNSESNTKTGFVGDGYIEGAYVCHDNDGDWDCLDETYATTAVDGSFVLSSYDPTKNLLVQVPVGAVDNGPFANGSTTPRVFTSAIWYIYPAGAAPQNGPIFIGPLSTLVEAHIVSVPGTTVDDAIGVVSTQLGVDSDDLLDNYIEDETNTTSGNSLQFTAEIANAAISSSTTATGTDYGALVADTGNIASTASNNNPSTYDTTSYVTSTQSNNTNGTVSLIYQGVADVYADLINCYFGFESWDDSSNSNEHKKLCLSKPDPDTGERTLNYTEHNFATSGWSLNNVQSSAYVPYQSKPVQTLIDMTKVNHATQDYTHPYRIFPAKLISNSGSSAIFDSYGMRYKLIISQANISGLTGAVLPKGPSLDALVNPITFGVGDKLYKAIAITQNKTYTVNNGYDHFFNTTTTSTIASKYIVYDEGTIGGTAFTPMPNTQDINAMAQLVDTDFIIEYQDSNNFTKISITNPYNPTALFNTCQIEHIVNGSNGGATMMGTFIIETHNGTPFFVVQNYQMGSDLFIGKIEAIDNSSFVYGFINPANISHDLTEGGYQNGDIMDDIMLNQSARDRLLNSVNAPLILP